MPASTPALAIPYPLGTDPVQRGDDDIKALAERVEALLEARPRGVIASVTRSSDTAASGSLNSVLSLPGVPMVAGRRYHVRALLHTQQSAVGFVEQRIVISGTIANLHYAATVSGIAILTGEPWAIFRPSTTGPVDVRVDLVCSAGTVTGKGSPIYPLMLVVEDVGTLPAGRSGIDDDGPRGETRPGETPEPKGPDSDDDT